MSNKKKNQEINLEDYHIAMAFVMDLDSKQKGVTISPGEESSVFPVLTRQQTLLKRLIDQGKIQKKQYEVPVGGIPQARLEWFREDFVHEFPIQRPREQIVSIIRAGRNGKFLSAGTLRRLRCWINGLPEAGGIGAGVIINAIDAQLRSMNEPIESPFDGDPNDPDYFEKQLAQLELEKMEREIKKPETVKEVVRQ